MRKYLYFIPALLLYSHCIGRAPADTLYYSAGEMEQVFLSNNLLLLAEKLNINQADARILQAKTWPNPTFTLNELQVYRSASTDDIPPVFGNFWRNRNFAMQLEQLIQTAGKRKKNIHLEIQNREMAEITFTGLLQALKAELRNTIAEILYIQRVSNSWQVQLYQVTRLVNAQQVQLNNGYISQADFVRLKALEFSLKKQLADINMDMNARQQLLKTMLYINPEQFIVVNDTLNTHAITQLKNQSLPDMLQLSSHNTGLRMASKQIQISEAQLAIEKAARTPDITLLTSYDRAGSTMLNFIGVGAAIDLPVFNRNKGKIKAARYQVQQHELVYRNTEAQVNNTVVQQWTDLHTAIALYESLDKAYIATLDDMTAAVSKNFTQHNISLLQFLDFYESFREVKEQYFQAIKNIQQKKEELNYLLGTELN